MIRFTMLHPQMTEEHLGLIPMMLSEHNPKPAREQIDTMYQHGGGWDPLRGWKMLADGSIQYPGDEPLKPLAEAKLREEIIRYYDHSWVCITQPDGTFEVSRMD
jgi:hypothetical protein